MVGEMSTHSGLRLACLSVDELLADTQQLCDLPWVQAVGIVPRHIERACEAHPQELRDCVIDPRSHERRGGG